MLENSPPGSVSSWWYPLIFGYFFLFYNFPDTGKTPPYNLIENFQELRQEFIKNARELLERFNTPEIQMSPSSAANYIETSRETETNMEQVKPIPVFVSDCIEDPWTTLAQYLCPNVVTNLLTT